MAKIISIHSFRGGTGKSNITANLATLLTIQGLRVGVVDADIQSPGIHVLFGLNESEIDYALNHYLWGNCSIEEATYDVTANLKTPIDGRIFLSPSSIRTEDIAQALREGLDVHRLVDGFGDLVRHLNLDILLIDTHPGLNRETLLSMAVSDALLIVLRPDGQDYQGTGVTLQVARQLNVPLINLIVNKIPVTLDFARLQVQIEQTYGSKVVGMLPHSDNLMLLASEEFYVLLYPNDALTAIFQQIIEHIRSG